MNIYRMNELSELNWTPFIRHWWNTYSELELVQGVEKVRCLVSRNSQTLTF